jgi:hypothetical protein
MPRSARVPSYCLHKPSGQARVILDGRHVYLGPHGSPQSRESYARLIAERFLVTHPIRSSRPAGKPARAETSAVAVTPLAVNELLLQYLKFAEGYYVLDGQPTGELRNLKDAVRPLRAVYGSTDAATFGPRALKAVGST